MAERTECDGPGARLGPLNMHCVFVSHFYHQTYSFPTSILKFVEACVMFCFL